MKAIFFIIIFGALIVPAASAQTTAKNPPFQVGTVVAPDHQAGKKNYLLSLSPEDFSNKKYVFYTDSNATVAYINIGGNRLRLTGGPNAEHIMAYVGNGYTVTLKNTPNPNEKGKNMTGTLVIYDKMGQAVVENVAGLQIK